MSKTKVITGPVVLSYLNCWDPKSINGSKPKYSVSLIIKKDQTETIKKIEKAMRAAYEEGLPKLKGTGKTAPSYDMIKKPLRDGDLERPDDPNYADSYFINCNSDIAPGVVDKDRNPILDRSEMYSGVIGRASINIYAYSTNGAKGLAAGLNHLQKLKDGTPLGSRTRAEDDFATDEGVEDFLD